MQKIKNNVLFSASDLANFLECEHLTYLDRIHLDTPMKKTANSEDAVLIQNKGHQHEAKYLALLRSQHQNVVDILDCVDKNKSSIEDKVAATLKAMQNGADIIYQATFAHHNLIGHADFLRKVSIPSNLGDYSYEVIDTKLSGKTQAKFIVQLIFYSYLLSLIQGIFPKAMYVVLGTNEEKKFYCVEYEAYFQQLLTKFYNYTNNNTAEASYPNPCSKCELCHWQERCEEQRYGDDHLCQVAGITKSQITKLGSVGITTMKLLADASPEVSIPKLNAILFQKIQHQAFLQHQVRVTGSPVVDLFPIDPSRKRGFTRLPQPDEGDLYFDMEGNPLEEGGNLEYLFGLYYRKNGENVFKGFWALTRKEEKKAFEDFIDFVINHLKKYPNANVYHYASYEETAIKRLMSFYGTREFEVDYLLRNGKLVDLYKVVRESMQTSEPKYSIKNIEHFYLEKREGEVTNAGASIIFFENWKATGNQQYLDDIEKYNIDDVRSTMELHRWLLSLRPVDLTWANAAAIRFENEQDAEDMPSNKAAIREQELAIYKIKLLGTADIPEEEQSQEYKLNTLIYQLMDFHRREAKPGWWAYFQRKEASFEELLEDTDAIVGLSPDPENPPETEKRSIRYFYNYPAQETKLHAGSTPIILETGKPLSNFTIDHDAKSLSFTMGAKNPPPDDLVISAGTPISAEILITAIQRFVNARLANSGKYKALISMLSRDYPVVRGRLPSERLLANSGDKIKDVIDVVTNLNSSYLIIQGPPGTGKTYTGSKVIVELLRQGNKVGIMSNSHKAINNLLIGVDKEATKKNVSFYGVKKGTDTDLEDCQNISVINSVPEILENPFDLIAGTAWLFSNELADEALDYLFIDEAGQVALANLVAAGTSAKNIVLLGDQMQLGQPIQGVHPGDSGKSALEFLLRDEQTVPENQGIFLDVTYRMHPSIGQFISDTVYDGRLTSHETTSNQKLILTETVHPSIKESGINFVASNHFDCTQYSEVEALLIKEIVTDLLKISYQDNRLQTRKMTLDDILIVTPYNLQVQTIRQLLPPEAKVGTVDKFQGQEAPVVIFSMVTSSGDDLPRDIEFLFSKNRLNVAISRAQALTIFIANPNLMHIKCNRPEEMAMVNTLCKVAQFTNTMPSI